MKTEIIALKQVSVNNKNPRTITDRKMRLLVESILTFPKMLEVRPVVVDNKGVALGGNMRLQALTRISKMSLDEIGNILGQRKEFMSKSDAERKVHLAYWQKWLEAPSVCVSRADSFTEAEKKQFVIADNASYGQWDYDALANEWDNKDLVNWGVDVWMPDAAPASMPEVHNPGTPEMSTIPGQAPASIDPASLPAELQNVDLTPDNLPKLEGTDETAMERIIIVYPKERAMELAEKIGLENIDRVLYKIEDLFN